MQSYGTIMCVCVCVCDRETDACSLVYNRSGRQSRQHRTKSKVTNQPTWCPCDTVRGQALPPQLIRSVCSTVRLQLDSTNLQMPCHNAADCINCHSDFSSLPIIATKFLSISFIPKFQYSHVCIKGQLIHLILRIWLQLQEWHIHL
jgi:hypothetical protein